MKYSFKCLTTPQIISYKFFEEVGLVRFVGVISHLHRQTKWRRKKMWKRQCHETEKRSESATTTIPVGSIPCSITFRMQDFPFSWVTAALFCFIWVLDLSAWGIQSIDGVDVTNGVVAMIASFRRHGCHYRFVCDFLSVLPFGDCRGGSCCRSCQSQEGCCGRC